MKLAFILFNYFPYGGLQRDFMRIAAQCHQQGHSITVYTMKWEGSTPPEWMTVNIIKPHGYTNHKRAKDFSQQVNQQISKDNFDKVIGFNKMPGLDIYYAADSCFVTKPQYYFNPLKKLTARYRTFKQLEKAVFNPKSNTEILIISKPEKIRYQHIYHTPEERLHLLPPGINQAFKQPADYTQQRLTKREKLGIKNDEYLLLAVASHFHTKGIDRAIKAIKELPRSLRDKVKLFVAGTDHPKRYRRLAEEVKSQIHFLGASDDVPQLMFAADLLLHLARHDNTGTVIVEAIVAGLPIITTARCGYASHVELAQAGEVIPFPYQQDQASSSLEQALANQQLTSWSNNALNYASNHDLHSLFDQAVALICRE